MRRAVGTCGLIVCGLAMVGCESAWRGENRIQEQWMGYAEGKPVEHGDGIRGEQEMASHEADCAKEIGACYDLGVIYLFGWGYPADESRAKDLLLEQCRASTSVRNANAHACSLVGAALTWGKGNLAADPERGLRLLAERCASRDAVACAYHGMALEGGVGGPKDLPRAVAAYDTGCSARRAYAAQLRKEPYPSYEPSRHPLACLRLAGLAEQGVIEEADEVVADLYADVCLLMTLEGHYTEDFRRIACPRAAAKFFEHGYTFEPILGGGGGGTIDFRGMERGADAETLAANGCGIGEPQSCEILRRIYALRVAQGELFDLR